eukprot:gene10553-7323_t
MRPAVALAALVTSAATVSAAPLKVFLLSGQSNMVGHAFVSNSNDNGKNNGRNVNTIDWLVSDPSTKAEFAKLKQGDGYTKRKD